MIDTTFVTNKLKLNFQQEKFGNFHKNYYINVFKNKSFTP